MTNCKSALESFANDKKNMLGGGYSVNVEDQIAGMATFNGYDDIDIHNVSNQMTKKLVGGAKKSSKHTIKRKRKPNNSKNKHTKNSKHTIKRKSKPNNSKNKKDSKKKNTKKKQQGGNTDIYPFEGTMSDYTQNTMDKDFSGKQPNWNPKTR
jgi:hypothetical protein